MWQICKDATHLLWDTNSDLAGRSVDTACAKRIKSNPRKQEVFPSQGNECEVCNGVWHIVCASVDDAKITLKKETDVRVLERVTFLSRSITLRKMAQARINKLKKEAQKERKLLLLQQAYD